MEHQDESLEIKITRMDERIKVIHAWGPILVRHDRELLIAKVVGAVLGLIALVILAIEKPIIAEALASVLK
jgi:hypothetical protein